MFKNPGPNILLNNYVKSILTHRTSLSMPHLLQDPIDACADYHHNEMLGHCGARVSEATTYLSKVSRALTLSVEMSHAQACARERGEGNLPTNVRQNRKTNGKTMRVGRPVTR